MGLFGGRRLLTRFVGMEEAAALLAGGRLVAFGTETVYGLGADATLGTAVAAIFTAKGRPHFNPLICHYPTAAAAFAHVLADDRARMLAAAFWPGPLTMVLPRQPRCPVHLLAGAGLDTLAVRVPAHPMAQALLEQAGIPVAAPSANRSGGVSPTAAAHVLADLAGRIDAILDCGPCSLGLESTVLDLSARHACLLRPGGVPADVIESLIGPIGRGLTPAQAEAGRGLRSPGLLVSHYAPSLPLRLDAGSARDDEALLAFGRAPPARLVSNLSESGDLTQAAARLFAALRLLDADGTRLGLKGIAAMPVPGDGLGEAIRDRLQRAAAPRS